MFVRFSVLELRERVDFLMWRNCRSVCLAILRVTIKKC